RKRHGSMVDGFFEASALTAHCDFVKLSIDTPVHRVPYFYWPYNSIGLGCVKQHSPFFVFSKGDFDNSRITWLNPVISKELVGKSKAPQDWQRQYQKRRHRESQILPCITKKPALRPHSY